MEGSWRVVRHYRQEHFLMNQFTIIIIVLAVVLLLGFIIYEVTKPKPVNEFAGLDALIAAGVALL